MNQALLALFVIDSLIRIAPTTPVPETPVRTIEVWTARNEYESAQIGIRASKETEVTVELSALRSGEGQELPRARQTWNFLGSIPITKNTPCPDPERLSCRAPCEVFDPLREERTWTVRPDRTEVLWLTFFVPEDAAPGTYRGTVSVTAGEERHELPVTLTVWPFAVPEERHLSVTNWVNFDAVARSHGVALWSEEFWEVWGRYLDNLRAHRQTMVWAPWSLIDIWREDDGRLTFDYARFDRFVSEHERRGVADRLEIQHVAHFSSGWGSPIALRSVPVKVRATGERATCEVTALLRDLAAHLKGQGRLEKSMVHIADEPSATNADSWREAARAVKQAAPGLRRIDAIEHSDFGEDLDVWVPKLSHLYHWRDAFETARARGAEMWFYICCHPHGGRFPNRFHDYPLASGRVLHWINAAHDLPGYLHWGLTFWDPKDPFAAPRENLPPGDTHAIYPGSQGPLSSVRWEAQRDSLEDYEYLWLLHDTLTRTKAALGPAADEYSPARRRGELARMLVRDPAAPVLDPAVIRSLRARIAAEITAAAAEPLALVWTYPEDGGELIEGPAVVEIHGVVRPDTQVTGVGRIAVDANGRFRASQSLSPKRPELRLRLERDGKTKEIVRVFRFRS